MGTAAAPSHVNNPFASYISQIDAISIEELVGEARFGPAFGFQDCRPVLGAIKDFVDQLRYVDGSAIPQRALGKVSVAFQEMLTAVERIKSYNPSNMGGDRADIRAAYTRDLTNSYESLAEVAIPVLLYSNLRSSGLRNAEARASQLLAGIQERSNEQSALLAQSQDLLEKQKKFAQDIAVTGYGTLFAKEARRHQIAARVWLGTASVFASLVGIFGFVNYYNTLKIMDEFSARAVHNSVSSNLPASLTIQFAIAKIVLFTLALSAAYWSARVYRSNRHNAVINQHRANALTSFETFVASTTDPEVKNAVLLQTTSCIYAPQPTAFASSTEGEGESPLKILEVVRNLQK